MNSRFKSLRSFLDDSDVNFVKGTPKFSVFHLMVCPPLLLMSKQVTTLLAYYIISR